MGIGALRNGPCECGSGLKRKRCHGHPLTRQEGELTILGEYAPRPPVRPLTGGECIHAATRLRRGLNNFNVSLTGGTDLERMLHTLEGLGRRHPGSFWEAPLTDQDKLDVRYIEQVTRFAAVLEALQSPRVSGEFDRQLWWFRKRLDTLTTTTETAQNFLLEIELGAALAAAGLCVSFEEPDLVVSGMKDLPAIAMPVKRPRSENGVENCVRDATSQAQNRGLPGVILVCLDAVVNSEPGGRLLQFWSRSLKGLNDGSWRRFKHVVKNLESEIRQRTDPAVIGIIWFARMPGAVIPPEDGHERPSYSRPMFAIGSVNQDHWAGKAGPLMRLLESLYRGLP